MEIAGRQVGAVGGVMENFPLEEMAPGFVASHNPGQKVVSLCAVTQ